MPPDPYLIDRAAADPFLESLVFPWAEDDTPPYKEEVVQRAQRCEPLLVSKKVHSRLASQLETARRCFIVGLHDAAVVFCRSLLEVAVFEFLYERKDLPRRDARTLPRQEPRNLHRIAERYKLADLLNQLAGYREVPEAALKKARDAKECGDKVLHSKGPGPVIDEQRALKVIRETVSFLERLSDSE